MSIARRAASLGVALAAALPALAHADSIVYTDAAGHVAIASPNGANARGVTASTGWRFPSQSDGGLVTALSSNYQVTVMNQFGGVRNAIGTPGSASGGFAATYFPRISPDGSKIAYTNLSPGFDPTVYWSPSTATSINTPNQSIGQQDMNAPSWIDSTHMLLTHYGETITSTEKQLWMYTTGGGDNTETGWAIDPYTPTISGGDPWEATGFAAAINRQQTAVAIAMDDNADFGGTTHNAIIHLFPVSGGSMDTTNGCQLVLQSPDGNDDTVAHDTVTDPQRISPSFSPDGTKLAFATDTGVWVFTLPTDYSTCDGPEPQLVIPGGSYPYWSAAGVQTPPPGGGGSNGGSNGGGSGGTTKDTTRPALMALALSPRRFAARKGSTIRYTLSEPATVTFTVKLSKAGRRKGRRCVAPTRKLRHAKKCTILVPKATLATAGKAGANRLSFKRKLAPGTYVLVAQAVDPAGNRSATRTASFTVKRR